MLELLFKFSASLPGILLGTEAVFYVTTLRTLLLSIPGGTLDMKILVVSDSHGNTLALLRAVAVTGPDMILHLGDHDRDCSIIRDTFPDIMTRAVRGNCDMNSLETDADEFVIEGKRVFMVHGDAYGVKYSLDSLITAAMYRSADVVLYGHTHRAHAEVFEDMLLLNPGSVGLGMKTYAVLKIEHGIVNYKILELEL